MENTSQQIEAVKTIQRNFRKYMKRKNQNSPNLENLRSKESEEKTEHSEKLTDVRKSLQSFYKKVLENADRDKYINDLITETDKISGRFKNIRSLEEFASNPAVEGTNLQILENPDFCNEATKKHQEKLRELSLKWWEKLNLSD